MCHTWPLLALVPIDRTFDHNCVSQLLILVPAHSKVSVSHMAAALARLSYQSGSGASHTSTIRCLPQQQQLHLLALATTVATTAAQVCACVLLLGDVLNGYQA